MVTNHYAEALRYIKDHPRLAEISSTIWLDTTGLKFFPGDTKENLAIALSELGSCRKEYDDIGLLRLVKQETSANPTYGITVSIIFSRSLVCQRVQVGTKLIPAQPAQEAQPEHEEPVYKWVCDEPVLGVAFDV